MQPKAIILDTDPGIGSPGSDVDDALAIVLGLLHPGCELLGLTIVAGNVPLDEGLRCQSAANDFIHELLSFVGYI